MKKLAQPRNMLGKEVSLSMVSREGGSPAESGEKTESGQTKKKNGTIIVEEIMLKKKMKGKDNWGGGRDFPILQQREGGERGGEELGNEVSVQTDRSREKKKVKEEKRSILELDTHFIVKFEKIEMLIFVRKGQHRCTSLWL